MEGLPPIIDSKTKILILGTCPSEESLQNKKYYKKSGNILLKVIGLNKDYSEKELLNKNIGFWDVFKNFEYSNKIGSSDKGRIFGEVNDFQKKIFNNKCNITSIIFNGYGSCKTKEKKRTSAVKEFLNKYDSSLKEKDIFWIILPSTSPNNRAIIDDEQKLFIWKQTLERLKNENP